MSSTALFRTDADVAKEKVVDEALIRLELSAGPVTLLCTDDVGRLEKVWKELQAKVPCTASQTYDWARGWAQHMLAAEGRAPLIAAGCDKSGAPLFLCAFELARILDMKVLNWLGQAHANYNMGLFDPAFAGSLGAADVASLLSAIAGTCGAAAAVLKSQPFAWDGAPNPLAKLPHQSAASHGYAVELGDFEQLYRRRFGKQSRRNLERKQRKLGELGHLVCGWAEGREERIAMAETLFAQKSRQLKEMGVRDMFTPAARAFYRELALLEGDNPSRLHLGFLKIDDQVAATFSGVVCHNRLGVAFSSLGEKSEAQKQSPGLVLLRYQIEDACNKGLAFYDIGVGKARHKDQWCEVEQKLFDSFIAFRLQGRLVTLPLAVTAKAKRTIKANRYLWAWAQRLREGLFGAH